MPCHAEQLVTTIHFTALLHTVLHSFCLYVTQLNATPNYITSYSLLHRLPLRCVDLLCKSSSSWRSLSDVKDDPLLLTEEPSSELSKSCALLRAFGEVQYVYSVILPLFFYFFIRYLCISQTSSSLFFLFSTHFILTLVLVLRILFS